MYVGQTETKLNALVKSAAAVPTLVIADEMHRLKGLGTSATQSNDIIQSMKPELARGKLILFGMDTPDEFNATFAGDQPFVERLTKIPFPEPNKADTIEDMKGWLKQYNHPLPTEQTLEKIYAYSSEFNAVDAQPRKSILLAQKIYATMKTDGRLNEAASLADVQKASIALYRVDPAYFDPKLLREKIKNVPAILDANIIGQPSAKKSVNQAIRNGFTGMNDPKKPLGMELWTGPPGTGKTELAKTVGLAMGVPVVRIEMNQYADKSPEDLMRAVAAALRTNAYSVIILDEIEKAPLGVQNALLAAFDDGIFSVDEKIGSGSQTHSVRVSTRKATFIATTNAVDDNDMDNKTLRAALVENGLSKPLVDRFQHISQFKSPTREDFKAVVELTLNRELETKSQEQGFKYNFSPEDKKAFVEQVTKSNFVPGLSNREVPRIVSDEVRTALSDAKLNGILDEGTHNDIKFRPNMPPGECLYVELHKELSEELK
jgi:ATP-dependent Clp protease ATP-binding subunit ClpA